MSLDQILDGLSAYLKDRQDEGEIWVECPPAVAKALSSPIPRPQSTEHRTSNIEHRTSKSDFPHLDVGRSMLDVQPEKLHKPATDTAIRLSLPTFQSLDEIAAEISQCKKCGLCKTRTRTVPGQGSPHPELVFIGEGPGADEDAQGLAFVGAAGQLLTRLIVRMGLTREEVWIGNVVKCRPPENRVPEPDEMEACLPYLRAQLALLKPKVIVTLGATALKGLLDVKTGITRLRGQWLNFDGIDLMPTFHPSYLLRGGGDERARYWEVWSDMEAVLTRLGKPIPEQKSRPKT